MKKAVSMLLAAALAASLYVPFTEASFKDVPASSRFYKEIDFLSSKGVVSGYPSGQFEPEASVTRAQAAMMIGRAFGVDGSRRSTIFSDVSPSSVASGYISKAVDGGVVTGFPDVTFRPNEPVTRGQMAILLDRAFELTDAAQVSFQDVSKRSQAYSSIAHTVAAGITAGYPDGTFRPGEAVTRGQFAAFLSRALDARSGTPVLDVEFLNVGQGEAILIRFPNGKSMLVDAGSSDAEIKAALKKTGADSIHTFVATHPDDAHIGGADEVIRNYGVQKVIDSGQNHTSQAYFDYIAAIQASSPAFSMAEEGDNLSPDPSVSVKVLHADKEASDLDEGSIVLKVSYKKVDYLLMSDAGAAVEQKLMNGYNVDAEVLSVSRRGESSNLSNTFWKAVHPWHAILPPGYEGDGEGDTWLASEGNVETWTDGQKAYLSQNGPPESSVSLTVNDPYWEVVGISSSGGHHINLSGWTLASVQGNQTYTFPEGFILPAGKTTYVTSGPEAKEKQPTYLKWTIQNMWAGLGDRAQLYDADGRLVSELDGR